MFGLGAATRVYVATGATDMRQGYEGLYGLVRDHLGREARSGHLFLFCNRARNRLKVLVWDGSGLWVCGKRLEKGRFDWPEGAAGERQVVLSQEELSWLLNGMERAQVQRRKGWHREVRGEEPSVA